MEKGSTVGTRSSTAVLSMSGTLDVSGRQNIAQEVRLPVAYIDGATF